jgi:hypothetical protein
MFGTKRPAMMSSCSRSAPADSTKGRIVHQITARIASTMAVRSMLSSKSSS